MADGMRRQYRAVRSVWALGASPWGADALAHQIRAWPGRTGDPLGQRCSGASARKASSTPSPTRTGPWGRVSPSIVWTARACATRRSASANAASARRGVARPPGRRGRRAWRRAPRSTSRAPSSHGSTSAANAASDLRADRCRRRLRAAGRRAAGRRPRRPCRRTPRSPGRRRAGGQRRGLGLRQRAVGWPTSAPGSRGRGRRAAASTSSAGGRPPAEERSAASPVGAGGVVGRRRSRRSRPPPTSATLLAAAWFIGLSTTPLTVGPTAAGSRRAYGAEQQAALGGREVVDRRVVPHQRRPAEHLLRPRRPSATEISAGTT